MYYYLNLFLPVLAAQAAQSFNHVQFSGVVTTNLSPVQEKLSKPKNAIMLKNCRKVV
jgi:hypothetical protein